MNVLADGSALCQCRDHRFPKVLRMRAGETDPTNPLDRVAGPQELTELGVRPPGRGHAPTS